MHQYPGILALLVSGSFMRLAQFAILVAILSTAVFAQTDRGTISGTVADPSGAAIPGAKVTAVQVATNSTFATVTHLHW